VILRRTAVGLLCVGTLAVLGAALGVTPAQGFALGVSIFPPALILLAISGRPAGRSVVLGVAALGLLLTGSTMALFVTDYPASALVMLVGLGLGPLVLVGALYAATHDRWGLRADDLERLRAGRREADR
jgi:hypothetical protein